MIKISAHTAIRNLIKKPKLLSAPSLALRRIISKSGLGVYASSDRLFKGAVFGRDSLTVAEDLMTRRPELAKRILLALAGLQGLQHHSANEEEPGKIIHEYRTRVVDGRPLSGTPLHIFNELSKRWGGTESTLIYYGSVDSTPHFIRALGVYCQAYGTRILKAQIRLQDGQTATLEDCLGAAVQWLELKLHKSASGLLEYHAHNPQGIANQAWKDSKEFYVHENGRFVNHQRPVASIEVQALAYDGLMAAAQLMPSRSHSFKSAAYRLRDRTIELLWQPDRNYFALGVDYEQEGDLRIITTTTANPASLLNSGFFDELDLRDKQKYVGDIIHNIMGTEFLTDAGVRSRAFSEANLIPFWDYHGSFVSWPKETYDVAKGLRRQGFPELAAQLENRLLNVVRKSRGYPEFLFVDPRGRVLGASSSAHRHTHSILVKSTNVPESVQAWTVSAVLAILASRRLSVRTKKPSQEPWQAELEKEVLVHIPKVPRLRSERALTARYPDYPYRLTEEHF